MNVQINASVYQHPRSGEQYIYETDSEGRIISAAGPLRYDEVERALTEGFDSDPDLVDDFNEGRMGNGRQGQR